MPTWCHRTRFFRSSHRLTGYYLSPWENWSCSRFPSIPVSVTVASVYRTCELFHRIVPHCATLMLLLHALLSSTKPKSQTITWTDSALAVFISTKEALTRASLLSYPNSESPTCFMTDTSDTFVGAVYRSIFFLQEDDTCQDSSRYLWQKTTSSVPCHETLSAFPARSTISCSNRPQTTDIHSEHSIWLSFTSSNSPSWLHLSVHIYYPFCTWIGQCSCWCSLMHWNQSCPLINHPL